MCLSHVELQGFNTNVVAVVVLAVPQLSGTVSASTRDSTSSNINSSDTRERGSSSTPRPRVAPPQTPSQDVQWIATADTADHPRAATAPTTLPTVASPSSLQDGDILVTTSDARAGDASGPGDAATSGAFWAPSLTGRCTLQAAACLACKSPLPHSALPVPLRSWCWIAPRSLSGSNAAYAAIVNCL